MSDFGLHTLKPAPGSRKARKRVGRGEGSGTGKTAGRGEKQAAETLAGVNGTTEAAEEAQVAVEEEPA